MQMKGLLKLLEILYYEKHILNAEEYKEILDKVEDYETRITELEHLAHEDK